MSSAIKKNNEIKWARCFYDIFSNHRITKNLPVFRRVHARFVGPSVRQYFGQTKEVQGDTVRNKVESDWISTSRAGESEDFGPTPTPDSGVDS